MDNDVIDLCDSYILADHHELAEALIELDNDDSVLLTDTNDNLDNGGLADALTELDNDDSIILLETNESTTGINQLQSSNADIPKNKIKSNLYISHKQKEYVSQKKNNKPVAKENQRRLGDCPICFDELGQNPLASTKCGHVYCMKCIQQHLMINKKCPTCRKALNGPSSYHSLYIT